MNMPEEQKPQGHSIHFSADSEIEASSPPLWLIDHILPSNAIAFLRGPEVVTSLLALTWALHIASGMIWQEHTVAHTDVAYLAGPNVGHSGAYIQRWKQVHQFNGLTKLRISNNLLEILNREATPSSLIAALHDNFPTPPKYIVLDLLTLSSTKSFQTAHLLDLSLQLRDTTGAHVLLLQTSFAQYEQQLLDSFDVGLMLIEGQKMPGLFLACHKQKYSSPFPVMKINLIV